MDERDIAAIERKCVLYETNARAFITAISEAVKRITAPAELVDLDYDAPQSRTLMHDGYSIHGNDNILKLLFAIDPAASFTLDDLLALHSVARIKGAVLFVKKDKLVFERDFENDASVPSTSREVATEQNERIAALRKSFKLSDEGKLYAACQFEAFETMINTVMKDSVQDEVSWTSVVRKGKHVGLWIIPPEYVPMKDILILMKMQQMCGNTPTFFLEPDADAGPQPTLMVQFDKAQSGPVSKRRKIGST